MPARTRRRPALLPVLMVAAVIPALHAAPAVLEKSVFISVVDDHGLTLSA
jgi:hypothetical protein